MSELREALADLEHDRWSRWMDYLFTKGHFNLDGSFTLSAEYMANLKRLVATPYDELSEQEKELDRKEADNTIVLIGKLNE